MIIDSIERERQIQDKIASDILRAAYKIRQKAENDRLLANYEAFIRERDQLDNPNIRNFLNEIVGRD